MLSGTPLSPEDFPVLACLLDRHPDPDPAVAHLLLTLRAAAGPRFVPAHEFAQRLGLPSRFALVRYLKQLHLPPYRDLHAHIRVLSMMAEARRYEVSLSRLAWCHGGDPASWLRLVKRVTGLPWSAVSALGMPWLVEQIGVALWGGRLKPSPMVARILSCCVASIR
jgi:hypothetical protein